MSRNPDHELPADLLDLERQLRRLVPVNIPAELHARLEACVIREGDPASPSTACFEKLEVHLRDMAPASMPGDMIERMVKAMDNWHERVPVEEKLVAFKDRKGSSARSRSYGPGMLSAVAAVALLGAITALMIPGFIKESAQPALPRSSSALNKPSGVQPASQTRSLISSDALAKARQGTLIGDSLSHKVTNSRDEGVLFTAGNVPHRCIRVDYIDRVVIQRADGRRVVLSRPGVKYVLYPVETY